jgi:long-subunit fatty acid transport protein
MDLRSPTKALCAAALAGAAGSLYGQAQLSPIGTIIAEQSRTAFTVQGAGARAMGLGGAYIAVADDATAVSFNPAGLSQMMRPELSFVGRAVNRSVAFQDVETVAGARTTPVDDSLISSARFDPLLLAGTVPLRVGGRTLAIQASIQRLIPLTEGDSRDMAERPVDGSTPSTMHQDIRQKGQIDLYSFAAAYEVSQRILLGGSLNYWHGAWDLTSASTKTTGPASAFVDFRQHTHLEGANYNLGLLWRWPTWSLGLTRRTAFHADYTYEASYQASNGASRTSSAPYTTGLHWPSTTGLGLAYRPAEAWLVALDVVRTPWSEARFMSARPALDGENFFDMAKGNRTPDATSFHAGVERLLVFSGGRLIPLRMGFSRDPQPVTDAVTGQQRVLDGVSAGTGFKHGRFTFDLAYRYAWGSRRASQFLDVDQLLSNAHPTSLGHERVTEHRLDLSLISQFDRAPVQDFLHRLFVGD